MENGREHGWNPAAGGHSGSQAGSHAGPRRRPPALVVDLEGGLLARDPVRNVLAWALRHRPRAALAALWRHRGRADRALRALARRFPDARVPLRVNGEMLDLIAAHRRCGGSVTLVGAAPMEMVEGLAQALGLSAAVYGSDRAQRFNPAARALALESLYGRGGFDYAGGRADQAPICLAARRSLMVEGDAGLRARLRTAGRPMLCLPPPLWQPVEPRLGDLCGVVRGPGAVRLLRRSLSAAIWAEGEASVLPDRDPEDWGRAERRDDPGDLADRERRPLLGGRRVGGG